MSVDGDLMAQAVDGFAGLFQTTSWAGSATHLWSPAFAGLPLQPTTYALFLQEGDMKFSLFSLRTTFHLTYDIPPHAQKMHVLSGKNSLNFSFLSLRLSASDTPPSLQTPLSFTPCPSTCSGKLSYPPPSFLGAHLTTPFSPRCFQSFSFYWFLVLSK